MNPDQIEVILKGIDQNSQNPTWLIDATVKLSVLNYYLSEQIATAELKENESAVNLLDAPLGEGEKKMSVAEGEKKALVTTNNEYGKLKLQGQALVEVIQTLKKKTDFLKAEMESSRGI